MKKEKKRNGRVNYVWVLAGGYLLYLAFQLFRNVAAGTSDQPPVGIAGGLAFTAIGGWLLWREWRAYQYGVTHKDDPESWGGGDETPEKKDGGDA